jgi:hypothetical protein
MSDEASAATKHFFPVIHELLPDLQIVGMAAGARYPALLFPHMADLGLDMEIGPHACFDFNRPPAWFSLLQSLPTRYPLTSRLVRGEAE